MLEKHTVKRVNVPQQMAPMTNTAVFHKPFFTSYKCSKILYYRVVSNPWRFAIDLIGIQKKESPPAYILFDIIDMASGVQYL